MCALATLDTFAATLLLYEGVTAPNATAAGIDIGVAAVTTVAALQEWWGAMHPEKAAHDMNDPDDGSNDKLDYTSALGLGLFAVRMYTTVVGMEASRVGFVEGNILGFGFAALVTLYSFWRSYVLESSLITEATNTVHDLTNRPTEHS